MTAKNLGQIIAIGGGGFGRSPHVAKIEKYILEQSDKKKPKVCFIPTASAENSDYIVNFYTAFSRFECELTHISFFKRTPNLKSILNKQDIIYVGGGNTKSMLSVWKEWKLDQLLLKAYQRGAILCGVSAGAICWFEYGITDSWASHLNIIECLNFLPGCCCPHYDGEEARRPYVTSLIADGKRNSCYAIEDGAALHFKNNKVHTAISFDKNKKSYYVSLKDQSVCEEKISGEAL